MTLGKCDRYPAGAVKQNIDHHCIMNYYFSEACSIEEEETVTITGGRYSETRVTQYQVDGTSQSLPNLNNGRFVHACGYYTNSDGSIVWFALY